MINAQEVNKRIQYNHDDEASSLTVKTSLLNLLSVITGSEKDAKKFCQETAINSKNNGTCKGGVSHSVFVQGFRKVLDKKILEKMTEIDFEGQVNERVQYTHDQEPSSMTIKSCLFKALSHKLGNDQLAKKFCQKAAIEAKDSEVHKGKVSNYVFEQAMSEVQSQ
jgi:hypothetical protein